MRWKLGKTFAVEATPAPAPAPAPPAKVDVEETVKGVDGQVLTVTLPATDPATHNKLVELRAYLVPHDQPPPADAAAFAACSHPHAAVDVSDWHGTAGGDLPITLPDVDRAVPYLGQLVHGYEE